MLKTMILIHRGIDGRPIDMLGVLGHLKNRVQAAELTGPTGRSTTAEAAP